MLYKTFLDIADSGIKAPSADNQHVFRLELTDSTIRLWPSDEFDATIDPLRRTLGLISVGAVVENMQLRANELGLACAVKWLDTNAKCPFAELNFNALPNTTTDELAKAIPNRHTNRRMYRGPKLNEDQTRQLNDAAVSVKGVQLIWLDGAARRTALGLIWRAESERFLRQRLHQDLFCSIRFDLPWDATAERALPPGALEIEAPMRPLFKALRNWRLMRPLTWLGIHHLIGLRAGLLPCWQAPTLGLLVTSLTLDQGAIAAGAALERVWLRATLLELAMQPLAASAMLLLQSDLDEGASAKLRSTLKSGWQTIAPGSSPMMLFRMGHAAKPAIRTAREPVNNYLRAV